MGCPGMNGRNNKGSGAFIWFFVMLRAKVDFLNVFPCDGGRVAAAAGAPDGESDLKGKEQ